MNFRTINVIVSREYLTRVKKKSFLLTTFLGPIFFAALCILPSVIMFMAEDKGKKVGVVDRSGIVMPYMTDSEQIAYQDYSSEPVDSMKARYFDLELDALVIISPLDSATKSVSVSAYSQKPLSVDMKEAVSRNVNNAIEDYRLASYDIKGLKQIMEDVKADIPVATYTMDDAGQEKISSSEVYMFVMQSVIEEKSSRVVEVLVSSVNSLELMFGKIIGVAGVALTQFFLWIVLTAILVTGAGALMGADSLMSSATIQTEQMAGMAEGLGVDSASLDPSGLASAEALVSQDNELAVILTTLKDLDYAQIILSFIVYFVLGYLLYASLFAAIGSAVENEADTQQLQMPVTIPLLIAFFIAFYAFKSPDSQVVFWGSMIPFTSPIVMLARIPFGVPAWEIILSIVLLLLTFVLMAYISAKIYRVGILMFGKKTTFKDLYRWLKQK